MMYSEIIAEMTQDGNRSRIYEPGSPIKSCTGYAEVFERRRLMSLEFLRSKDSPIFQKVQTVFPRI